MTVAQDEDGRPPPPEHRIGEALDFLSVDELYDRIAPLRGEIARLDAAVAAKRAVRGAAEAAFKL